MASLCSSGAVLLRSALPSSRDLVGESSSAAVQELSAGRHGSHSTSWHGEKMQRLRICAMAKGPPKQGRGYEAIKASVGGVRKRMSNRELDQDGWVQVGTADELIEGKNKAIIHDNTGYVIVKRDTSLYTIKANCTSCQFPVVDGKVEEVNDEGQEDITIDCPLCHTKVSLVDGKVAVWCPKDGPLQWIVGTLKEKVPPVPAKVCPTRQSNAGRIYVKFVNITELRIP
ncbi:unnamed protein product [Calypogeia fissa]